VWPVLPTIGSQINHGTHREFRAAIFPTGTFESVLLILAGGTSLDEIEENRIRIPAITPRAPGS
jgi:hypothetical protein